MGFLGCVFVLLVLVTIVLLIFRNARKAKDQKGFFHLHSRCKYDNVPNADKHRNVYRSFACYRRYASRVFQLRRLIRSCPFDFSRSCSGSLREARPFAQIRNEVNAEKNLLKLLDFSVDLIYRTLITKGAVFFSNAALDFVLFRLLTVVFRYSLRCRSFCHILFQPLQDTSHTAI